MAHGEPETPVTRVLASDHRSPTAGRLRLLTLDNGADHTRPTTLDAAALESLDAAVADIEATLGGDDPVAGVLLTGKPYVFAAGADLDQLGRLDADSAREAARRGHEVFGRLRDLPVPTLAAINGACVGGGLELALHCDARTVSTAAGPIGFPEVFLSIVPAWGGTQLATRLLGSATALQVIVANPLDNNRLLRAEQAQRAGLADALIPAVDFLEVSLRHLEGLVTGAWSPPRDGGGDGASLDDLLAAARKGADDRVHGATPAPYRAIELIEHAARGGDLAEGLRREEEVLAELLPSRQARAALYAYDLTQRRAKRQPGRPEAAPRDVRRVGVVGAGLMGAQLGSLFLQRLEVPLVMVDVDEQVLRRARERIDSDLDQRVERGRLDAGKAGFLKSAVTYTTDTTALAGSDLVLEAIVEDLDAKRSLVAALEGHLDESALLVTNTSALSVTHMAEALDYPQRMVGLHFFNPVAVLPLVELVRTKYASAETIATAFDIASRLRKTPVVCADAPAFVVNRLLTRFMVTCAEAVDRGNDFAEVDDAIKELGLPMGPFELLGLVGPRVAAHVATTLADAFPDRFPRPAGFAVVAASGLPGVYDWSRGRTPYEQIVAEWPRRPDAAPLSDEEIRTAALEAVADEIRHLLSDEVVTDPRDIDTCMLLGAGWPVFMGGICPYLDAVGISDRVLGGPLLVEPQEEPDPGPDFSAPSHR